MANIRRNHDFSDGHGADPGVGEFVADQFLQLFADAFRETLCAVRVQILE